MAQQCKKMEGEEKTKTAESSQTRPDANKRTGFRRKFIRSQRMYHVTTEHTHCLIAQWERYPTLQPHNTDCKLYHLHSLKALEWCRPTQLKDIVTGRQVSAWILHRIKVGGMANRSGLSLLSTTHGPPLFLFSFFFIHVIHPSKAGGINTPSCTVNLILNSTCRNPKKQSV